MIALILFTGIVVVLILCLNMKDEKQESPKTLHDPSGQTIAGLIMQRNMGNYGAKTMLDIAGQGNPGLRQLDKIISPMFPGPWR